ncbi:MAG TPA: hypothetical protein VFP55_08620 [Solirubrobacteraceae bacterium]|nr:hypothetical protein [Solirubrobacteraceae bacterium]
MATQTRTQREQAGKKAAATRKRNAASRSATATRRSATRTGRTVSQTRRTAAGAGRQARTTALLGSTTLGRELDSAGSRFGALTLGARRGVAIQVGAALEARDAMARTVEFAARTASRTRTLRRLERRGERALNWNKRR